MNFRQIVCVFVRDIRITISVLAGQYRVVMQIGVFKQPRDGINAKPGNASIEPEAHSVVHGLPHLRIAPVQIGLFGVKVMVVILIRSGVEFPSRMAKPRLPVVGRLALPFPVAPDVPVALRICARRTRFLKPRMLVRSVIRNKIHDHSNVALLGFTDHPIKISKRAVERIDGGVIRDIVAEIHQWRRVHGANPDRIDAQVAKIIQARGNSVDVANGIASRQDYLRDLGIDAIWISPMNPSPLVDFGYDISDYTAIDPLYGTLADFDRLVSEAKKRDIRVIMDFVPNHTSEQHPWFKESRSSRTNPKRDWYIWRDGKGPGEPPNNWQSWFGHSAWKFDPTTNQYYYHHFYTEQPDLNWRNPQVRKAMYDAMRFWLNKGVAGFRLDAVPTLFEDEQLRDEKVVPGTNAYGDPNLDDSMTNNLPELHQVMRELRKVTNSYPGNRVLIGETYLPDISELRKWYGGDHDELQLPMDMQVGFLNKLDAGTSRTRIDQAEHDMDDDQPLFVFDNHDNV